MAFCQPNALIVSTPSTCSGCQIIRNLEDQITYSFNKCGIERGFGFDFQHAELSGCAQVDLLNEIGDDGANWQCSRYILLYGQNNNDLGRHFADL